MFAPIDAPPTSVDSCETQLRELILSGRLAVGERLPPERRLAEMLSVGRVTVRSALGRLATHGLLAVRQGSGYVVQDFRDAAGPGLIPSLLALADDPSERLGMIRDVLRMRRAIASALFERLTEGPIAAHHVQAVASAIEDFAGVIADTGDRDALADADLAILRAILDASESAVLRLCMNPVSAVVRGLPELREVIYAEPETNLAGWRLLLGWLEQPDRPIDPVVALLASRDRHTLGALAQRYASSSETP